MAAGNDTTVLDVGSELPPNTVYWFAPGVHTITASATAYVEPATGDSFIGAPGAVFTGQSVNRYAFFVPSSWRISNVTVSYLTIEHFNPPFQSAALGTNAYSGWVVSYSTIEYNYPGSGLDVTTGGTATYDCLTHNGQYGALSTATTDESPLTGGASDVTLTHDEISSNDICNLNGYTTFPLSGSSMPANCVYGSRGFPVVTSGAVPGPGCGCAGGVKFWRVNGSVVEYDEVANNYGIGLWWDTDDNGAVVAFNLLSHNWVSGITYEISYNALIEDNTFLDNAWQPQSLVSNPGFPYGALYLNQSAGDPLVPATGPDPQSGLSVPITSVTVAGNKFTNNWSGIVEFQNATRYCHGAGSICTLDDPGVVTGATCSANLPASGPAQDVGGVDYWSLCQWKLQNVVVEGNTFTWSATAIPNCVGASNTCGEQALIYTASVSQHDPLGTSSPYGGWLEFLTSSATSGTFTLTVHGSTTVTTAPIADDAAAADVQAALDAVAPGWAVSGAAPAWVLSAPSTTTSAPYVSVDSSSLLGGTATVSSQRDLALVGTGDVFSDNTYTGAWTWSFGVGGVPMSFGGWQACPVSYSASGAYASACQDAGSAV